MALIAFNTGAFADTTVHEWFDDDGVVHFGESPPDNSKMSIIDLDARPNSNDVMRTN